MVQNIVGFEKNIYLCKSKKTLIFLNAIEMKKSIIYLFVVLVVSAMFVACDTTQNGTEIGGITDQDTIQGGTETGCISDQDKANATQLLELFDANYSHLFVEGVTNDYWMSFFTSEIDEEEGYPKGSCEFVSVEFFPITIENGIPVGDFAFAENPQDGSAWAGWDDEEWPQGSYVFSVEDGEVIEIKYIVAGRVVVCGTSSAAEVLIEATFEDGTKSTYYYEGKLKFEDFDDDGGSDDYGDYTFDFEPTAVGEYETTFEVCRVLNHGNVYNTGSDNVELYLNGIEWLAYYDLFAPLNSGEDIYGTYTVVADKYDEWCAVPSSGGNDYGDTPSFFATDFTEDGYYNAAYYVVSGSVVIAEDGITIDAVSYNGSKIKGSYVGEVVVETSASQYVKSEGSIVTTSVRRAKLVKASVEDLIYFGALKNRMRK